MVLIQASLLRSAVRSRESHHAGVRFLGLLPFFLGKAPFLFFQLFDLFAGRVRYSSLSAWLFSSTVISACMRMEEASSVSWRACSSHFKDALDHFLHTDPLLKVVKGRTPVALSR